MSLRKKLGRIFVCAMLETAALCGVPVSAREIESLMQMIAKPKVERVWGDETGDGDDPGGNGPAQPLPTPHRPPPAGPRAPRGSRAQPLRPSRSRLP